jgi:hypothetical protein
MATYISDGSPSDIQAKVNGASAGDTISVPSGSYTWTAGVTISKSITLSGAGSDNVLGIDYAAPIRSAIGI